MTKAPKKTRRGGGRVAFLAHMEDFRKMIEAGHPLLGIYQGNREDLGISYSQFARYVATYITKPGQVRKYEGGLNEHQKIRTHEPVTEQITPPPNACPRTKRAIR